MEDQTLVQVGLGLEVYMEVDRKYYMNSSYLWTLINHNVTALHFGELKCNCYTFMHVIFRGKPKKGRAAPRDPKRIRHSSELDLDYEDDPDMM